MLWFTAAVRRPAMLLPRWLFPQVKGKHGGKSESQCPHWEFCTDFSQGGISPGSCCNAPTWFTHGLHICFILRLEGHFPHFFVTVDSTDKVLSKIKMLLYWNKWPYSIGLKDYVSVTASTSSVAGRLRFLGLAPEELGCALALHHPPQPPGPRRQEPQCGGWQGDTLYPKARGFATGQPSSYLKAQRGGLKWWYSLLQCHPQGTKVFGGFYSFELEPKIVTNENCFANIMDVKECKFYQYYGYLKMPVMPIRWILKNKEYFCKLGFLDPLFLTSLEFLRFLFFIFPERYHNRKSFLLAFFLLSFFFN